MPDRSVNWPNIAALAVWLLSVGTLLTCAVRGKKEARTDSRNQNFLKLFRRNALGRDLCPGQKINLPSRGPQSYLFVYSFRSLTIR